MKNVLKFIYLPLSWLFVFILQLWAAGVIYFCSFPEESTFRGILAIVYLVIVILYVFSQKEKTKALFISLIAYVLILFWFSMIKVDPDAVYPQYSQAAHAEIKGDQVTLHKVRNFNYRTRDDFDIRYETRKYDISKLKTVDLLVNYWGIDSVAHTLLSFGFSDGRYLSVSIEIRPEVGEQFGLLDGFFKQYEIIYVWADERDSIRLRTNYRGEDAYLYRSSLEEKKVQALFISMLKRTNDLYQQPEFYNTLLESCTNTIGDHLINDHIYAIPIYKRRFLSGDVDRRSYQEGLLVTFGLPFDELRQKAYIAERAKAANKDTAFSKKIRTHLTVN